MDRIRRNRSRRWGGVAASVAGLLVLGSAACGGPDSRQEAREEANREDVGWQTGLSDVTVDSAPSPAVEEIRPPVNVTFAEAEAVFRAGDYEEAARLFEAYAERRPENPWGHYMVGISAWRAGDHAGAEEALRRAVEVDPEHPKGLLNLARVLLERGEAHGGLESVERLVELEPRSGEGWRVLGNARSSLGQVDSAVEAYREALVLDPLDSWTMNNLGLLLIRAGRYEQALGPLARATHLRPEVAVYQNNLGIALERCGFLPEAAEAFRAALESDPGHERASVSLERVEGSLPGQLQLSVDLAGLARDFEREVERWRESKERTVASESRPDSPVDTGREDAEELDERHESGESPLESGESLQESGEPERQEEESGC